MVSIEVINTYSSSLKKYYKFFEQYKYYFVHSSLLSKINYLINYLKETLIENNNVTDYYKFSKILIYLMELQQLNINLRLCYYDSKKDPVCYLEISLLDRITQIIDNCIEYFKEKLDEIYIDLLNKDEELLPNVINYILSNMLEKEKYIETQILKLQTLYPFSELNFIIDQIEIFIKNVKNNSEENSPEDIFWEWSILKFHTILNYVKYKSENIQKEVRYLCKLIESYLIYLMLYKEWYPLYENQLKNV